MKFVKLRSNQFIIFAHARSGSTTLLRILNLCEGIHCPMDEPFHRRYIGSLIDSLCLNYYPEMEKKMRLKFVNAALSFLFSRYNGYKHLWCQLTPSDNKAMLRKKNLKVIFLYRKNAFDAVVSNHIAAQTGVWDYYSQKKILLERDVRDVKISKQNILKGKKSLEDNKKFYKDFMEKNNISYFELRYEDLLGPNIALDVKFKKLNEILSFLGAKNVNYKHASWHIIKSYFHYMSLGFLFKEDIRIKKIIDRLSFKRNKMVKEKVLQKVLANN